MAKSQSSTRHRTIIKRIELITELKMNQRRNKINTRDWLIIAGLIMLSLVPANAGSVRIYAQTSIFHKIANIFPITGGIL